jgi:hypothetical protein
VIRTKFTEKKEFEEKIIKRNKSYRDKFKNEEN